MSRLYDFKSYSFIVWDRDENWFTLDRILMDFFHEFGYQNGSGIFHFGGIAAGIGLLLGGWMFFCIVRLLLRLKSWRRTTSCLCCCSSPCWRSAVSPTPTSTSITSTSGS